MTERVAAYHHGNLRSALLDEAERAIAEDGVEALSLRQLARELGVSHAAPSRHFRDKQALLDALALEGFETLNARLDDAARVPGSARDRLDAAAHAYVGFAVEHSALLSLMYTTKHAPDASERLREVGQRSLMISTELLRDGQATGEIGPGDPDRLALVSFAAVHGVATLATNDLLEGVPVREATESTVALLWAGLTAEVTASR